MIASLACNGLSSASASVTATPVSVLPARSSSPTTGAAPWIGSAIGSDPPAQGAGLVDGVSCPERNFCVAVDSASNAYTSTTPVRGGWSAARPLKKASQATHQPDRLQHEDLCVEVDNRGTVTYGVVKAASSTSTKTTTTTKTTHDDRRPRPTTTTRPSDRLTRGRGLASTSRGSLGRRGPADTR